MGRPEEIVITSKATIRTTPVVIVAVNIFAVVRLVTVSIEATVVVTTTGVDSNFLITEDNSSTAAVVGSTMVR